MTGTRLRMDLKWNTDISDVKYTTQYLIKQYCNSATMYNKLNVTREKDYYLFVKNMLFVHFN